MASLKQTDTVVDAYSGIGTIGLSLADKVAQVYGMEVTPQAVTDAQKNAKINEIDNAAYVVGKAETVMPKWKEEGINLTSSLSIHHAKG